ncbi:hypothetical protein FHC51_05950 [Leclercia sp. EC_58]|uniref:hypothetical protein n=1 Tax=Leclercia sp. EC_58 TaxID=2584090 RepID=UPI001C709F72|nr:hypothetical protein [Leclercia sp. EC_58]MBW9399368.1 hypothetical protein [Leclercia sp. EC_58]
MFAVAEFGSVCRNTNDLYSDNDILIICNKRYGKYYYDKYHSKGYSVSTFSEEQLYAMKSSGSLFLQHLKKESKILIDNNLDFTNFLKDCSLTKPSEKEIDNCKNTIQNLISWPNYPVFLGWKSDFLYGASRDFLIKFLAKNGIIAFGIDEIISELCSLLCLNIDQFSSLKLLRQFKSAYRTEIDLPTNIIIRRTLESWAELLQNIFGFNFYSYRDEFDIKDMVFSSNYERLRYLEIIYICLVNSGFKHAKHTEITNLILKPNLYQSLRCKKTKLIINYLEDLYPIFKRCSFEIRRNPIKSLILL